MAKLTEEEKRIFKAAGARIKLARERLGLTQEDFCSELAKEKLTEAELDDKTLRGYENNGGKRGGLRWKTIRIFTKYFGIPLEILTNLSRSDGEIAHAMVAAREGDKEAQFFGQSDFLCIPDSSRSKYLDRLTHAEDHSLNQAAALSQVRRLSSVAAKDAGFIAEEPDCPGAEIRLEQDLYVKRSIEEAIHRLFDSKPETDPPFLMISGEAGFGKTSLLWQMHRTMMQSHKWEPWFVKSTFLIGQSSEEKRFPIAKPNLSIQRLHLAALAINSHGKKPALLLDTADLLLGNEEDRQFLINLLLELREYGAAIIVATRPQEAFYLRPLEDIQRLELRDYNEGELEEAISRHVSRFYAQAYSRDRLEHTQRIRNAVVQGLPIHDVCTNPLTLRMLFSLYIPEEVPSEINAFKLYENFWELRVLGDHRAGSPFPQYGTDDLSKAASAVALTMLAEGAPEIDSRILARTLLDMGGSEKELKQLVSRGVIHHSEGRTIRFFHQTFFEHSAARGLLDRFRKLSIKILEDRMRERPYDLFVNPVFEHLLLLCETQPAPIRREAEDAFKRLLRNRSLLARSSAIYVYAHQQTVSKECVKATQRILPSDETAVISRFVNLAHNMPHARLEKLVEHLDAIWERQKWEEQYDILELLERLAERTPKVILSYLYRHQILEMACRLPPLGYKSLFKTLEILVRRDPKLCDNQLLQKILDILTGSQNPNLQTGVLDTLCKLTRFSGMQLIPEACEKVLLDKLLNTRDISFTAFQGFGCLLAEGWHLSKTPLSLILSKISNADGFYLKSCLYGLSEFLLTTDADETESAMVWHNYVDDPRISRQWVWSNIVIPRILRGEAQTGAVTGPKTIVQQFRDQVRKLIARESAILAESDQDHTAAAVSMLCGQIKRAIHYAQLSAEVLLGLINCKSLDSAGPWLGRNGFFDLLPIAYSAGHAGAVSALRLLTEAPQKYPVKVVSEVAKGLAQLSNISEEVCESTLVFLVKTETAGGLHRLLESDSGPSLASLKRLEPQLTAMRQRLISSTSGIKRRQGAWLWIHLLRIGLDTPPSQDEILGFMRKESDQQARAWLALLLGHSSKKGRYDTATVIEILWPLCTSKDENLREKAMTGLFEAIIQLPSSPAPFAERLMDAALSRPTDANRLSQVGVIIERLIPENIEMAKTLLERLLLAPEVAELGHQAKRWLITRLRKPTRLLFRYSSTQFREQLLKIVPRVDAFIGRILVDAACHDAFLETVPVLDRLLFYSDVESKVKELIRRHKHQRERTLGGGTWSELYNKFL